MRRGVELLAAVVYAPTAGSTASASVLEGGVSLAFLYHQPPFPAAIRASPSSIIS